MLETAFLDVNGHKVRYASVGSGPPMLLLHGYPETLHLYAELAPRLADRFTVIAIDWPGLGASDPWPGPVTPTDRATHVIRVLDVFGHDRAYLFGTDMAAPPALVAAATHPQRVRGVVVSNALLFPDGDTSTEIDVFRRFPIVNRVGLRYLPRLVFERCLQTFLPASVGLDRGVRREFWQQFQRRRVRECLVRMCADYEATLESLPTRYADVDCPVFVCWGARDYHFPPSQGRRLAARLPTAEVAIIDDGEHWMAWHRAATVAAEVLQGCDSMTN